MFDKRTTEQFGKLSAWSQLTNQTEFINVHELIECALSGRTEREVALVLDERTEQFRKLQSQSNDKLITITDAFREVVYGRGNNFHKVVKECSELSPDDVVYLSEFFGDFMASYTHQEMVKKQVMEKTEITVHDDLHVEIVIPILTLLPFVVKEEVIIGAYRIIKEWIQCGRKENTVFAHYPLTPTDMTEDAPENTPQFFISFNPKERENVNHVGIYYSSTNDCFMAKAYIKADDVFAKNVYRGVGLMLNLDLVVITNANEGFENGEFRGIDSLGFILKLFGRPFSLDPYTPIKEGYREYPKGLTVKRFDERHEITLDVAASEVLANGKELFNALSISVYRLIGDKLFCMGVASMDKSYPGSEGRILIEAEVNDFLPQYDYYKAEICPEDTGKLIIKIHEGYNEGEE